VFGTKSLDEFDILCLRAGLDEDAQMRLVLNLSDRYKTAGAKAVAQVADTCKNCPAYLSVSEQQSKKYRQCVLLLVVSRICDKPWVKSTYYRITTFDHNAMLIGM
jgi:hypothetical protein